MMMPFPRRRKILEEPQVIIFSIINNALATVKQLTRVSYVIYGAFMWISWSWSRGHTVIEYNVSYEICMALKRILNNTVNMKWCKPAYKICKYPKIIDKNAIRLKQLILFSTILRNFPILLS